MAERLTRNAQRDLLCGGYNSKRYRYLLAPVILPCPSAPESIEESNKFLNQEKQSMNKVHSE